MEKSCQYELCSVDVVLMHSQSPYGTTEWIESPFGVPTDLDTSPRIISPRNTRTPITGSQWSRTGTVAIAKCEGYFGRITRKIYRIVSICSPKIERGCKAKPTLCMSECLPSTNVRHYAIYLFRYQNKPILGKQS
jgi:hypothetical protein